MKDYTPILSYRVECCGYELVDKDHPVYWNPFNKVVQCHNCGTVYGPNKVPESKLEPK